MDNVTLIQEAYKNFAEGNIPAVLGFMNENIEWQAAKGFPFFKDTFVFYGPDEVVNNVFARIPEHYEGFNIEPLAIFGSGDKVVMQGFYTGKWKETGKAFKANAVHIWEVKDGKVTQFFQAVDTAEIVNPG